MRRLLLIVLSVLVPTACNPQSEAPVLDINEIATQTAAALPTALQPPTDTPLLPAETPTEAFTPTHTSIPTLAPTQPAIVTANVDTTLRTGPGENYPATANMPKGKSFEAKGRNDGGDWIYLGNGIWVSSWDVSLAGDLYTLPIEIPPPSPTPAPPTSTPYPTRLPATRTPLPTPPPPIAVPTLPPPPAGGLCQHNRCDEMTSCEEAYACLNAGNRDLDRDGDGVPCESICPGG